MNPFWDNNNNNNSSKQLLTETTPTQVTLLLVVNNALQGILSSFFFKFADTILKKYSSTIATIFTGVMSAVLFGHQLTLNFCLGVSIVFISMHLFFSTGKRGSKSSCTWSVCILSFVLIPPYFVHVDVQVAGRQALSSTSSIRHV